MNRLCLDTSAYSNFQRGRRQAVAHIDQGLDRRAQRGARRSWALVGSEAGC